MLCPVIMAGGSGSRLWPLSRTHYPKQFLSITSCQSMLQETVLRLEDIKCASPIYICNEDHRFLLAEQLRQKNLSSGGIILEPMGKNTAPAIALAALHALKQGTDPVLLVLAADHVIQDVSAFTDAVHRAQVLAEKGKLVTFGIVPNKPETGYGYIRKGEAVDDYSFNVDSFVEKPDFETAKKYLSENKYYWNSGMFMFRASRYLSELKEHCPKILEACDKAIVGSHSDLDFIRLNESAFNECPDDSIDYAVMEKTDSAVVVPMDASWSDVGSWSALWDVNDKDDDGNAVRGDVLLHDTRNSYIYSQDRLVATVGVQDLVVVETKDAVLVANKHKVQDVKCIVSSLKAAGRSEVMHHRDEYRPWGSHESVADGERFHVKKVKVKPGHKTATQVHYHRAEHWVVVSGTAKVRNGDESYLVHENESTYIPNGSPHSFENPGKIPLEIIEVRTGVYLEEDDIVRLDSSGNGY